MTVETLGGKIPIAVERRRRSVVVEAKDQEAERAVWMVPSRTSRKLSGRNNQLDG